MDRELILDSDDEDAIIEAVEAERNLTTAEIACDTGLNEQGVSATTIE